MTTIGLCPWMIVYMREDQTYDRRQQRGWREPLRVYRRAVAGTAIVAIFLVGCSSEPSSTSGGEPSSSTSGGVSGRSGSASSYEALCIENTDKVVNDSQLSAMGFANMTLAEKISGITDATLEAADDWYSTTSMTLGDEQRTALEFSVDEVVNEYPNRSNYTFKTYAGDPNDASTHAWCLSK